MTTFEHIEELTQPRTSRSRHRLLISVLLVAAATIGFSVGTVVGDRSDDAEPGRAIDDQVMVAWRTADPADISAVYADDAVFVFDGEPLATGIDEITDMIDQAVNGLGNTYRTIGPVASYRRGGGDLYVSFMVEVRGPGHPDGAPVTGFYRVHDGVVIRHDVTDAEHL